MIAVRLGMVELKGNMRGGKMEGETITTTGGILTQTATVVSEAFGKD
jgi:hypothetical protein|eukprot:COSAG02_NODE_201_length_29473_cov_135.510213_4_plen_47_part_00